MTKKERSRIMRRVRAAQLNVKFCAAESQLLQLSNFRSFRSSYKRSSLGKLDMGENLTTLYPAVEVYGEGKFDKSEI